MQAEPLLQLFIPDAPCLECPHNGGLECIDLMSLLQFACSDMVMKRTELLELMMHPAETLAPSFGDQLHCLLLIVHS